MKKILNLGLMSLAMVAVLAACGKGDGDSSSGSSPAANSLPVFGSWRLVDQTQNGLSFKGTISVSEHSMSASLTCSYQGQSVTSQVTANAQITGSKIKVLESKSDPKTLSIAAGNMNCEASLEAKEMAYTVSGNSLTLVDANGRSTTFPRVQ